MRNWRAWIVAAVVLGASTWGALWWSGRSEYARFVSAPLKDETRYTFLYPKRMNRVAALGIDVHLEDDQQPSFLEELMAKLKRRPLLPVMLPGRTINVAKSRLAGGIVLKSFRRNVIRSGWHDIHIWDARSQYLIMVSHSKAFRSSTDFERDDKVLRASFAILRPGAPVPSP